MNRLKSFLAITAGVVIGMAAGVLLSSRREQLTVNIRDNRTDSHAK